MWCVQFSSTITFHKSNMTNTGANTHVCTLYNEDASSLESRKYFFSASNGCAQCAALKVFAESWEQASWISLCTCACVLVHMCLFACACVLVCLCLCATCSFCSSHLYPPTRLLRGEHTQRQPLSARGHICTNFTPPPLLECTMSTFDKKIFRVSLEYITPDNCQRCRSFNQNIL